jgi:UDP-3-O-[3-hydroxymyristoyl] glucosamine N-acyltransferase
MITIQEYPNDKHGYVSERATVNANVIIAPNVQIFGKVFIGKNVIIEPNVIIGHLSPIEQANLKSSLESELFTQDSNYYATIDAFTKSETIIGEGTIIRSGSVIYSGSQINSNVDIAHNCLIRENCQIGRDTQIISGAQVMGSVVIGHGCRIAGTLANRTRVGNGSSMLGHVMHKFKVGVSGQIEIAPEIGKGVIIGRESAIVGDVKVGDFSIVGAGAVIIKSIPERTIWVGNPAKQVRRVRPRAHHLIWHNITHHSTPQSVMLRRPTSPPIQSAA